MAKFCSNCGAPMADEDLVCGQCGTPAEAEDAASVSANSFTAPLSAGPASVKATPATSQNAKIGKIIVFSVIGLVALLLLLLVGSIIKNNSGYKGTLNKAIKAIKNENVELMHSVVSPLLDDYLDYYNYDVDDFLEDYIEDRLDKFEDKAGTIFKITYKLDDFDLYSERKAEKFLETYEDRYDSDIEDIKQVAEAKVKITVKGSKRNANFTSKMILVKHKNGWKILDIED